MQYSQPGQRQAASSDGQPRTRPVSADQLTSPSSPVHPVWQPLFPQAAGKVITRGPGCAELGKWKYPSCHWQMQRRALPSNPTGERRACQPAAGCPADVARTEQDRRPTCCRSRKQRASLAAQVERLADRFPAAREGDGRDGAKPTLLRRTPSQPWPCRASRLCPSVRGATFTAGVCWPRSKGNGAALMHAAEDEAARRDGPGRCGGEETVLFPGLLVPLELQPSGKLG